MVSGSQCTIKKVHVLAGNTQVGWNYQSSKQKCSINELTYKLEMHKRGGIIRAIVSTQTTSRTSWDRGCTNEVEWSEQQIMSAQSTSSRTSWKRESKTEWSERQSVLNQQFYVPSGNAQAKKNRQSSSQCPIDKFTYKLEMHKSGGIVRAAVSDQLKSSRTSCKFTDKMKSSERRSGLNQQIRVQAGNAQARQNRQSGGQCSIIEITYNL